jgi:hypothetical protein
VNHIIFRHFLLIDFLVFIYRNNINKKYNKREQEPRINKQNQERKLTNKTDKQEPRIDGQEEPTDKNR